MLCESTDFMFPMQADVYYPIVEQGQYGTVKKQWILDKTIACSVTAAGTVFKEEVTPNINITKDQLLIGRVKNDIRISDRGSGNGLTNVIVTNIRDSSGNPVYIETDGVRAGKSTLYEIATQHPYVGPMGNIEFYNIIIRRSENQVNDV